jgi:hypothetical protein
LEKFYLARRKHGFHSEMETCMLKILNTVENTIIDGIERKCVIFKSDKLYFQR